MGDRVKIGTACLYHGVWLGKFCTLTLVRACPSLVESSTLLMLRFCSFKEPQVLRRTAGPRREDQETARARSAIGAMASPHHPLLPALCT